MDVWVQNSQHWLNQTYGSNPGYLLVDEDGMTGWSTMYALTRALQIELRISPTSTSFGPTTLSRLITQVGDVSSATVAAKPRIVGILQCAMWCKGYWGHTTFGQWDTSLGNAIMQLRGDMGLSPYYPTVTPKMFKSLLTMSAFTLLSGGSSGVRGIQQWMNGRYIGRSDFYLVPCDGIYSRDVQKGLMFAIQYEIGMADGTANGNFGPGTKSGLQTQANLTLGSTDSSKQFVHLFQAALTFNQYPTTFDGVFGTGTRGQTAAFQAFSALPVSNNGDFATWASLLVSTGDTTRAGTAVDCITTITNARATTLINAGYHVVGRYLTNTPVPNPTNKNIKPGELATIALNGLAVFPIFQEGGDGLDYFSYLQGKQAALKAHAAATAFGFGIGTHIYFAVDFDAYEAEVWSAVVPHFQGIRDGLASVNSTFKVGIYGARNTCSIVSAQGLAHLSFVSDMSTGFSGNLGFPLPTNWAFDQILEYTAGTGTGSIGIDKDIASGRDTGQSTAGPGITLLDYVDWMYNRAINYRTAHPTSPDTTTALVFHYLRHNDYDGTGWDLAAGAIDDNFIAEIDSAVWYRVYGIVSPGNSQYIGAAHLAATANSYLVKGTAWSYTTAHVTTGDMAGWAGDLAQVMAGWVNQKRANPATALTAYNYGLTYIARLNPDSFYSANDFDEDTDALNIVRLLVGSDIASVMRAYYAPGGGSIHRYSTFVADRFFNDWAYARQVGTDVVDTLNPECVAIYQGLLSENLNGAPGLLSGELTPANWLEFVDAWIHVMQQKISEE